MNLTKISRNKSFNYGLLALLLLLVARVSDTRAQSDQIVHWGYSNEYKRGTDLIGLFGSDSTHFYSIHQYRRKRDGYKLEKFGTDSLELIEKVNFVLPAVKGQLPQLAYPVSLDGRDYLLSTVDATDSDTVYIYAFEILADLQISGSPKLLGVGIGSTLVEKNGFRTYFDPSETVMALIIPRERRQDRNEKFEIRLFDARLNLLEAKKLEAPHLSDRFRYDDVLIDSTRSVYLLASLANTRLEEVNEDRNIGRNFSLFNYTWESGALVEKSLTLQNKWLYDVRLLINSANNLQIAGYYSNMVDLIMAGTFSLEIDRQTGKIINQGLSDFERDFRVKFRPAGGNITETELGLFNLDYCFPYKGNKVQLISEKTYTETSTVFNPATGTYSIINIFNFDEVLISAIGPDSKSHYNVMVPKYQSSYGRDNSYSSYLSFKVKDQTYLVYNDNERNAPLSLSEDKKYRQMNARSETQTILTSIDKNGNMKKIPLFKSSSRYGTFNPEYMLKTSKGIVLVSMDGFRIQYFKLLIN